MKDILVQRAVKTAIQILYDEGLFDDYANADKVLEDFLFTTRRRGDLSEQVNDNEIQYFIQRIKVKKFFFSRMIFCDTYIYMSTYT